MDWPGILIGGAITLLVSLAFYVPAARGLKRQTELIMRGIEEAAQEGLVKYRRNAKGKIVGLDFFARAHISGSSDVGGTPTVRDDDDPADQEQRMQGGE